MAELYKSPWRDDFEQALRSVRFRLMIVAPYITKREAETVRRKLKEQKNEVSVRTLTSLNVESVLAGALNVGALEVLANVSASSEVFTLPRLHAKIYVFDESRAVVGSANLTTSALDSNFEYGVALTKSSLVQQVIADVKAYARLGSEVRKENIAELSATVDNLATEYRRRQRSASKEAEEAFRSALADAGRTFSETLVGERSAQETFSEAVLYVLSDGPAATRAIHPEVQKLLPDLCDDDEELVINGDHFGKSWKHQVRNAQQSLKRKGMIDLTDGKWHLTTE
jgi:HKD family nuclease